MISYDLMRSNSNPRFENNKLDYLQLIIKRDIPQSNLTAKIICEVGSAHNRGACLMKDQLLIKKTDNINMPWSLLDP